MLLLWLKSNLKCLVRPFSRRQKKTLSNCLDKRDRARMSKKKIVFLCCLIFTIFYIITYKRVDDNVRAINFLEVENLASGDTTVTENNRRLFDIEVYTKNTAEKTNGDLMEPTPMMYFPEPRQFFQRENLPRCVSTYVNVTVDIKKKINDSIDLTQLFSNVETGGHYAPPDCQPQHKVAILVPIRRRDEQLRVFLYNIHPFLMTQKLEYRIVVIEQSGTDPFNRGRLFNVGFREIQVMGDYQCVVFHDVDLLPTDYRIRYSCPMLPRHMCASVIEEPIKFASNKTKFNGVTAMTVWQFRKVNGYSNSYWGGHGEDEDMLRRLQACGLGVTSYKKTIGRYTCISNTTHVATKRIDDKLLKTAVQRYKSDGFLNLHYDKLSYAARHLYTKILVDINPPKLHSQ